MGKSRTSMREALRFLSFYLNHYEGESVSVKTIADELDISWGMAHNCLITIQQMQNVAPTIVYEDELIIGDRNPTIRPYLTDDVQSLALHLFSVCCKKSTGSEKNVTEVHLELENQENIVRFYGLKTLLDVIEREYFDVGCSEQDDARSAEDLLRKGNLSELEIKLTTSGAGAIGPLYAKGHAGVPLDAGSYSEELLLNEA